MYSHKENFFQYVFFLIRMQTGSKEETNLMGILCICFVFGRIIGELGDRGRELHSFFEALSKSFIGMIQFVIL